jgi:hypothetical protein
MYFLEFWKTIILGCFIACVPLHYVEAYTFIDHTQISRGQLMKEGNIIFSSKSKKALQMIHPEWRTEAPPSSLRLIQQPNDEKFEQTYDIQSLYAGMTKIYAVTCAFVWSSGHLPTGIQSLSGLLTAAGISNILSDAAKHDRLGSDTYKRLNLGLVAFNVINMMSLLDPTLRLSIPPLSRGFRTIAFSQVLGALIAALGWKRGLRDGANPSIELLEGIKATIPSIWRTKGRGALYRNILLPICAAIAVVFWKLVIVLYLTPGTSTTSTLGILARLTLVTTMLFSLKDAGERNRLKGTTFIQMNALIGIWSFLSKYKCSKFRHDIIISSSTFPMR